MKLKERPVPTPQAVAPVEERTTEAPAIPDDLLDRISAFEKNSEQINSLKNDLSCVKYEVKKLKKQPILAAIPDDLLERLAAAEKNANEVNTQI